MIFYLVFSVGCKINPQNEPNKEDIYCRLIDMSLANETLKNEFYSCSQTVDSFILYDLNDQLVECTNRLSLCGIELRLVDTNHHQHAGQNELVLYFLSESVNNIELRFLRPYSGAAVFLTYSKIEGQNKYRLIDTRVGSF